MVGVGLWNLHTRNTRIHRGFSNKGGKMLKTGDLVRIYGYVERQDRYDNAL